MEEKTPRYVHNDAKEYVCVSDFAHLPPSERPTVYCSKCGEIVTMKLGKVLAHHFAHKEATNCVWTPESIAHLNTKLDIAKALEGVTFVRPYLICPMCEKPTVRSKNVMLGWNRVAVECQVGGYVADVALLDGTKIEGVLEIRVTHDVTNEKSDYFSAKSIKWIEFAGFEHRRMWTILENTMIITPIRTGQFIPEDKYCLECTEHMKRRDLAVLFGKYHIPNELDFQSSLFKRFREGVGVIDVYSVDGRLQRRFCPIGLIKIGVQIYSTRIHSDWGDIGGSFGRMEQKEIIKAINIFADNNFGMQHIIANGGKVDVHPVIYEYDYHAAPFKFVYKNGVWVQNPEYWVFWRSYK